MGIRRLGRLVLFSLLVTLFACSGGGGRDYTLLNQILAQPGPSRAADGYFVAPAEIDVEYAEYRENWYLAAQVFPRTLARKRAAAYQRLSYGDGAEKLRVDMELSTESHEPRIRAIASSLGLVYEKEPSDSYERYLLVLPERLPQAQLLLIAEHLLASYGEGIWEISDYGDDLNLPG
jgi:hypothetical protein